METNADQPDSSTLKISHEIPKPLHPRYRWLDQFRSVVMVFLFISSLTWVFSGDIRSGELPIGPTWLNLGWKYAGFYPRMITLIDIGSQIFMFILGISLTISFQGKQKKKSLGYAWASVFNRVFIFFWLAEVMLMDVQHFNVNDIVLLAIWAAITITAAVLRNTKFKHSNMRLYFGLMWSSMSCILWFFKFDADIWAIFFGHQLSFLAWGTMLGALFLFLIKKADVRIAIPVILLVIHFYLWETNQNFNALIFEGTPFQFTFMVPFEILGMTVVAITATCVWDWIQMDPDDFKIGVRKRFVPLMVITTIAHFVVDFFQTANSEGINSSIALLAIAFSSMLAMCMYAVDNYFKFNAPFLTSIGKNGLFLFLLQAVLTIPYMMIWPSGGNDFRVMVSEWLNVTRTHALVNLMGLIAFIIPITILIVTAWLLDKYKIRMRVG